MSVEVEVTFDKDIQGWLNKIEARTNNLQPVLERAATIMQGDVFRHFADEEGSKGKWKPLTASTKRWKAKKGFSKMLQTQGD